MPPGYTHTPPCSRRAAKTASERRGLEGGSWEWHHLLGGGGYDRARHSPFFMALSMSRSSSLAWLFWGSVCSSPRTYFRAFSYSCTHSGRGWRAARKQLRLHPSSLHPQGLTPPPSQTALAALWPHPGE